jgi:GrpB-like predicted nucleotidyltransferase (UPF0157 family)
MSRRSQADPGEPVNHLSLLTNNPLARTPGQPAALGFSSSLSTAAHVVVRPSRLQMRRRWLPHSTLLVRASCKRQAWPTAHILYHASQNLRSANVDPVHFRNEHELRSQAQRAFELHRSTIARLVPAATIEHVGSTAIPGSLTKGDVDLLVSVPAAEFWAAEAALAQHYERNAGSLHNDVFASFKDDSADPPLGIQLTCDETLRVEFIGFREALLRAPELLAAYNDLKQACEGMTMDEYRQRKDAFIRRVLDESLGE